MERKREERCGVRERGWRDREVEGEGESGIDEVEAGGSDGERRGETKERQNEEGERYGVRERDRGRGECESLAPKNVALA